MQKLAIMLVVSGALIVIGLVMLVIGNQIVLEGVSQGNGKVSLSQTLTISGDFDKQEISTGVFAVQVMEFKDNTFSARVLDSSEIEIVSKEINEETIEEEFDVLETGAYKLIIESTSNEETHVFGAIGPLPDAGKKTLGFISVYVLVIGMVGLVGVGVYAVKKRKRSI
ncbi:MAG: hypothetical protein OEM77_07720 [Nitrosopumilus sp.]|nr:hypothetical protein [Nitrosopumilus sp.]MDH3833753.1 hypothetical protein [Nitrosopumilus sp.]